MTHICDHTIGVFNMKEGCDYCQVGTASAMMFMIGKSTILDMTSTKTYK
jgi:hypothetical protein